MVTTGPPAKTQGAEGADRKSVISQSVARGCLCVRCSTIGTTTGLCAPPAPSPPSTVSCPEGPRSYPGDGLFPPHHLATNDRCGRVIGRSAHGGPPRADHARGAGCRVASGAYVHTHFARNSTPSQRYHHCRRGTPAFHPGPDAC